MSTTTAGDSSATSPDSTSYIQVMPACRYCGAYHEGTCPRVEELEYYPNGTLKRVRLRQETPIQIEVSPSHAQTGHTCGVDCPATTWTFPA